jgi:hypothetical protein
MSASAGRGLSRLQRAILAWLFMQAGAAGEPVGWRLSRATPTAERAHVSRSLQRLEGRGLVRRLSPSLTTYAGRTGFVELTEAGAAAAARHELPAGSRQRARSMGCGTHH